jgi:hypothetical protein
MKPIIRRSVIASLAALAVTFGLLLPTAASAQSDPTMIRRANMPMGQPRAFPTPRWTLSPKTKKDGWTVISIKNDWKRIFGFDSAP